ncbi:MAG: hypothetical protein ACYTG0_05035 [Planctomycetota bacterium]|jgi:hypothetical protein
MKEPQPPELRLSSRQDCCTAAGSQFKRRLRLESLEPRRMLSGSGVAEDAIVIAAAPPATDVPVAVFTLAMTAELEYRMHGINFSPYIAPGEDPGKGDGQITDQELQQRIALVSPYAKWIRTFGCSKDLEKAGQIAHALGNKTALGAWIGPDAAANQAQIDCLVDLAIQGHADMVIVGSEVLLRGDVTKEVLIDYINDVKARLAAAQVDVPVTTADVYGVLLANPEVIAAVDVVLANYYPFWEGISRPCPARSTPISARLS